MKNVEFVAKSKDSKEALTSARLASSLPVNVIISAPKGCGKKLLALEISNEAPILNNEEFYNLYTSNIEFEHSEVIVDNFNQLSNIPQALQWLETKEIKLIALSDEEDNAALLNHFQVKINIPPLKDRKEDIRPLSNIFLAEAMKNLGIKKKPEKLMIDTTQNAISLRKSIYLSCLFNTVGENELLMLMEDYLQNNIDEENGYKSFYTFMKLLFLEQLKISIKANFKWLINLD